MGYLIRLDRLPYYLEDERWTRDGFASNFPADLGRPPEAFPHLCFVFAPAKVLTHVGVVLRKGDANSTFTYKLPVVHVSSVGKPIPLGHVREKLHKTHRDSVDKALARGNGTLTASSNSVAPTRNPASSIPTTWSCYQACTYRFHFCVSCSTMNGYKDRRGVSISDTNTLAGTSTTPSSYN